MASPITVETRRSRPAEEPTHEHPQRDLPLACQCPLAEAPDPIAQITRAFADFGHRLADAIEAREARRRCLFRGLEE